MGDIGRVKLPFDYVAFGTFMMCVLSPAMVPVITKKADAAATRQSGDCLAFDPRTINTADPRIFPAEFRRNLAIVQFGERLRA